MAGKNLHVVPHKDKWAVKSEGSTRVSVVYNTKQEAIDAARELACTRQVDFLVHGRDGQLLLKSKAKSGIKENRIREAFRSGSIQSARGGGPQSSKDASSKKKSKSKSIPSRGA